MKKINNFKGFSLIELLISMALGLLLLAMVLRIYSWQAEISDKIQDLISLQDNGRLAMNILIDAIHSADDVELPNSHELEINNHAVTFNVQNGYLYRNKKGEMVQDIKEITFQKINAGSKIVGVHIVMELQALHGLRATWSMTVAMRAGA